MYEVGLGLMLVFPDGRNDCQDLTADPTGARQAYGLYWVLADGHELASGNDRIID